MMLITLNDKKELGDLMNHRRNQFIRRTFYKFHERAIIKIYMYFGHILVSTKLDSFTVLF